MAAWYIASGTSSLGYLAPNSVRADNPVNVGLDEWINNYQHIVKYSSASKFQVDYHIIPPRTRDISRIFEHDNGAILDVYLGLTPFVEMRSMIDAGIIEPWNNYMPKHAIDDILPVIRDECSVDGKLYSWPFLVDIHGMAWNSRLIDNIGLSAPPSTWAEYLEDAANVVESFNLPYGATFDPHGWRSLVPFAHSFSSDIYTEDGLFDFSSEAAEQAIVLMKKLQDLSHYDILHHGASYSNFIGTPDEVAFASQQVGFYTKYLNAPLRMAQHWDKPAELKIAALPKYASDQGSSLFWTTGAALLKNGKNKEAVAEYILELTYEAEFWKRALAESSIGSTGQIPPYRSIYTEWRHNPPHWLPDYVLLAWSELQRGSSIANHPLSFQQFVIGQAIWEKYLNGAENNPKAVLSQVTDAISRLQ